MTHAIARDDLVPPPARTGVAADDVVPPVLDLAAVAVCKGRSRPHALGVVGASDLAPSIRTRLRRTVPATRSVGRSIVVEDPTVGWPVRALFLVAVLLFLVLAAYRQDIGYAVYDVHEVPAPSTPGAVIV